MAGETEPFSYLAAPARRALARAGVGSLVDLGGRRESEIARLHGMGPNAMLRLKERMAGEGVCFAQEEQ